MRINAGAATAGRRAIEAGFPAGPAAVELFIVQAFHDHAARVQGTALRLTRDPELAADVTQEAFLRLVIEVRAGRIPDQVGAWLHRTSANLVVSRARHESVARRHAPKLASFDGPTRPDAVALLREDRAELHAALALLTSDERAGLLMAANGASGAQIALWLGRSPGATRTMLSRARTRLRLARSDGEALASGGSVGAPVSAQA